MCSICSRFVSTTMVNYSDKIQYSLRGHKVCFRPQTQGIGHPCREVTGRSLGQLGTAIVRTRKRMSDVIWLVLSYLSQLLFIPGLPNSDGGPTFRLCHPKEGGQDNLSQTCPLANLPLIIPPLSGDFRQN